MEGFFTSLLVGGKAYEVTVEPDGVAWRVQIGIEAHRVAFRDPLGPRIDGGEAQGRLGEGAGPAVQTAVSLMPGKVVRILVAAGDTVAEGQGLIVIEAMKMENEVPSPAAGRVLEIKVAVQEPVEAGAPLVVIGRDRTTTAP
jgi:biotin carboxyl carrier protein